MTKPAQKTKPKIGSTQKFTEIKDIQEDIVVLSGNQACLILELQATNFLLLSENERAVKITAYGSVLNSLSFPIQILIRSKKVNIISYLKQLDNAISTTHGEKLISYMKQYREFVQELIRVNTVLDKKFYVIIPFSSLEEGPGGALKNENFAADAKTALHTKAESLLSQLSRLSLQAKILGKEELVKLFYDIYNQELNESYQIENVLDPIVVKTAKQA
ncbi:MAG: hypothetical protein HYT83_01570 [Candidatus Levybacteria bacterium]|nr:hypothetical protein [Candidatus Levybacteria bacterium]